MNSVSLTMSSADETAEFGTRLGPLLGPGDVILLSGGIGAGKTHFARSVIQHRLGRAEDVPSPTFTLVQTYEAEDCEIWHSDLYRLTALNEIDELGLFDAFEDAIVLIEWPDRLENWAPENALSLSFALSDTTGERQVDAQWNDPKWDSKIAEAAQ